MNARRDRTIEAIIDLLEVHGITIDEIAARLSANGGDGSAVSSRHFVDGALALLSHNTRRTYRTHLMLLINGTPRHCECTCEKCCDISQGCSCRCRVCEDSATELVALGDTPVGAITYRQLKTAASVAQRLALKRGADANRKRVEQN